MSVLVQSHFLSVMYFLMYFLGYHFWKDKLFDSAAGAKGGGTSWSFVMLYLLFIHLSVGWQFSKKLESPFNFEFIAPMKTKLKINRKVFCFFICRFQAQQWQQKKKKSNYVGIPNGILKFVISWNDSSCIQGCILILCPINIVLIFMMLPYK